MNHSPDHHAGAAEAEDLRLLESALSGRTEVSAEQAERLRERPLGDLDGEVRSSAEIIKRMADAVAAAMHEPARAASFLETMDVRIVTRDHDWRAIFGALRDEARGDGQRERVALWNYLAYLCSRRDLIEEVVAQRRALERTNEMPALELEPRPTGLLRLPKDEAVIVTIPYRGALVLRLGRHEFKLVDGYPPCLVDPDGGTLKLQRGMQMVGRHPGCELVTDAEFQNVSRAHMDIEWNGDSHVAIIDRSTHGTFVDAGALAGEVAPGPCSPAAVPRVPGDAGHGRAAGGNRVASGAPTPLAVTRFSRGN